MWELLIPRPLLPPPLPTRCQVKMPTGLLCPGQRWGWGGRLGAEGYSSGPCSLGTLSPQEPESLTEEVLATSSSPSTLPFPEGLGGVGVAKE